MDFLYSFFQTCNQSHYFKGIIAIDRVILCTIHSNLWSVPLFQRNYCDRLRYSLYNFFQTCDRSHYFKGIIAIDRLILCTISFKLVIGPIISKELLWSIDLFSMQFQGTCDLSVQIFKGIVRSVQIKGYYCSAECHAQIFKRLLERNFGLRKLKCKYFPSLGFKDNEGWVKSNRFLNLQEL